MKNASKKMYAIIGKEILKCRKEQGLTQKQLAAMLDVKPQTVQRYETGIKASKGRRKSWMDIPLTRYEQICRVLGINGGALFTEAIQ